MKRMSTQRLAARHVRDLIKATQNDDSDFEDVYESSGDEFKITKSDQEYLSDSSDDDQPLSKIKLKFKISHSNTQTQSESSASSSLNLCSVSSDDEDVPLLHLKKRLHQSQYCVEKGADENHVTEVDLKNIEDPDLAEVLQNDLNHDNVYYDWVKEQFQSPNTEYIGVREEAAPEQELKSPYQYFKLLVTDEMISKIRSETNMYAMQKEGIHLNTTDKEIEIMIGIYMRMGLVKMPRVRAYWESESRFGPIAEKMSRNRFEKMTSLLHFCDNLSVNEEQKVDKIWKLRPWLDGLRERCLAIPTEENHSVDEIMVSFKGKSSIKQYIRGKPNPWGFKIWGRCGSSGILYDFDVYQGASPGKKSGLLGVGGNVVMKLVSSLESGKNHKLFADNYFTSMPLVHSLAEKSIWYVGTVRANRLKGCQLKTEKELKREGRGSVDFKVDNASNTVALRWYDNKAVDVVSSYVGAEPMGEVRRWDKSTKRYIVIKRPCIIETYNRHMGGVDLLDSLTSLYKQKMKSRRWYMYIFWHTLLIAVVNSWLWYKRHSFLLHTKPMKLCKFISHVATGLTEYKIRIGRPSSISPPAKPARKSIKRPIDDCRLDAVGHFPVWDLKRQRCKNSGCDAFSFIKCVKCDLHLCLNKERNCFTAFHI